MSRSRADCRVGGGGGGRTFLPRLGVVTVAGSDAFAGFSTGGADSSTGGALSTWTCVSCWPRPARLRFGGGGADCPSGRALLFLFAPAGTTSSTASTSSIVVSRVSAPSSGVAFFRERARGFGLGLSGIAVCVSSLASAEGTFAVGSFIARSCVTGAGFGRALDLRFRLGWLSVVGSIGSGSCEGPATGCSSSGAGVDAPTSAGPGLSVCAPCFFESRA